MVLCAQGANKKLIFCNPASLQVYEIRKGFAVAGQAAASDELLTAHSRPLPALRQKAER